MKDIILVITLLMVVSLSVGVVHFAEKANKVTKNLEEERYSRMVAEETLQKNDAKLTTYQEELKEDQGKIAKIADVLEQEKGVNSDLKKQYDELMENKADLEAKLKSVLKEKASAESALKSQTQAEEKAQPSAPAAIAQPAVPPASQTAAAGH